jgi:hypothetical protein
VRIAAFGPDGPTGLATANVIFPITQDEDDWSPEMPPVLSQIGGAHGAFDYYDDAIWPISPLVVTKNYRIVGTYNAIQATWNSALDKMLELERSKLWGVPRGVASGQYVWAYAKLSRYRAVERAGRGQLAWPVSLVFTLPEGIWYTDTLNTQNVTSNGNYVLTNPGSLLSPVKFSLTPATSAVTKFVANIGSGISMTWDDSGGSGVLPGNTLVIDCEQYSILNNGIDAYDKLSIGSGQVVWFALPAFVTGGSTVTITVTQVGGTYSLDMEWKTPHTSR